MADLREKRNLVALLVLLVAIVTAIGAHQGERYRDYLATAWDIPPSKVTLYKTDYWLGELVESIVERGEYRGCYTSVASAQAATVGMCFSAHRMPVIPWFVAIVATVHNDVVSFLAFKTALLAVLLCITLWMLLSPMRRWAPLGAVMVAIFFFNPTNFQMLLSSVSEESFSIPLMALAAALLFVRDLRQPLGTARLLGLTVLVMLMPMTKSSAVAAAGVIAVAPLVYLRRNRLAPLLPPAGLLTALLLWGAFTYHATGHFAFGGGMSSVNGYNLHHGFTKYYGEVAPRYHLDLPVLRGQIKLEAPVKDEWEFNKHFTDRTVAFIKENPGTTAWYAVIKIYTALFKITPEYRLQSGEDGFFLPKHLILTAGLLIDRLILWGSFALAVMVCWRLFRGPAGWRSLLTDPDGWAASVMIFVTLGFVLPFVVAFANYRHLVPLYYFQAIYIAAFIVRSPRVVDYLPAVRLRNLLGDRPAKATAPA